MRGQTGIDAIAAERRRQIDEEGFTPEIDAMYAHGQIGYAASCYARYAGLRMHHPPKEWPWLSARWKPKTRREDLVRAGALIAAEIDRLDRADQVKARAIIAKAEDRQPVAPQPTSSEAERMELAEALNRAEAAERELEDVRKERDTHISAYLYLAIQAEREHIRVAELSAELDRLRSDQDSVSTALRTGLDPFAVVLSTHGLAEYADRWRTLAAALSADLETRKKGGQPS